MFFLPKGWEKVTFSETLAGIFVGTLEVQS